MWREALVFLDSLYALDCEALVSLMKLRYDFQADADEEAKIQQLP
jgi:hypothetical protein